MNLTRFTDKIYSIFAGSSEIATLVEGMLNSNDDNIIHNITKKELPSSCALELQSDILGIHGAGDGATSTNHFLRSEDVKHDTNCANLAHFQQGELLCVSPGETVVSDAMGLASPEHCRLNLIVDDSPFVKRRTAIPSLERAELSPDSATSMETFWKHIQHKNSDEPDPSGSRKFLKLSHRSDASSLSTSQRNSDDEETDSLLCDPNNAQCSAQYDNINFRSVAEQQGIFKFGANAKSSTTEVLSSLSR